MGLDLAHAEAEVTDDLAHAEAEVGLNRAHAEAAVTDSRAHSRQVHRRCPTHEGKGDSAALLGNPRTRAHSRQVHRRCPTHEGKGDSAAILGNRRAFVAAPTPRSPPHEEPAAAAAALMQQPFSTSRSRLHSTTRSRSGSAGRRSTLVATSVGSEDDQEADPRRWSIEADGRILKAKPITLICYFVFALKYLIFFQGTGIRARA